MDERIDDKSPLGLTSGTLQYDFGMLYEKFVFADVVRRLLHDHSIKSVCEYPCNDLMGNNSEEFERLGCSVKRLTTPDLVDEKYDFVWNFCEFEKAEDPHSFVQEIMRLSKKYAFIVTQNKYNVVMFHRIYHLVKGKKWNHGSVKLMSWRAVMKVLSDHNNLDMVEVGAFDVPWFVLDFYEGGSFFRRLVPKFLVNTQKMKKSVLENFPIPIKALLAHHHYVLCRKKH